MAELVRSARNRPPAAFAACAGCHSTGRGATHKAGPNLFGIVGGRAGTRPGFNYSAAMRRGAIIWTRANLARFIHDPRGMVPGTTMPPGARHNAVARDAIVAYLATLR